MGLLIVALLLHAMPGFALGNMSSEHGTLIYVLAAIAVHACTCSCLTSAFIYRTINAMHDDDAVADDDD